MGLPGSMLGLDMTLVYWVDTNNLHSVARVLENHSDACNVMSFLHKSVFPLSLSLVVALAFFTLASVW